MGKLSLISIFILICVLIAQTCAIAPLDSSLVFIHGEGGYYCHKIPYLLRTMSNVLIAFAEGRGKYGRTACDDYAGTDLVYKRSFDNGLTWSPLQVFFSNSTESTSHVIGNAAPVQDQKTGRIWTPFCEDNEIVYMTYSDDDGETWAPPVLQPQLVRPTWKWVGLGPPGGIQLSTGRLLIPGYHTTLIKGNGLASKGHTIYSDDGGRVWRMGSADFGSPYLLNECQAVELKNGSVLINARTLVSRRVQIISDDGGLTFGNAYVVPGIVEPMEGISLSMSFV